MELSAPAYSSLLGRSVETQRHDAFDSWSLLYSPTPSPASQGKSPSLTQRSIHLPVHPPTFPSSQWIFAAENGITPTGDYWNKSAHSLPTTDTVENDLFSTPSSSASHSINSSPIH
ncbi:hypothetical protein CHARACLAT_022192 [Characodon lateralis]|uniref:Uncharacterized protein n=1 Tax=Characodon lateralis TaxID=208331 RepID=A0ABU7D9L9_9TELE|nr:hypothetical protein [Characodon lateralis]